MTIFRIIALLRPRSEPPIREIPDVEVRDWHLKKSKDEFDEPVEIDEATGGVDEMEDGGVEYDLMGEGDHPGENLSETVDSDDDFDQNYDY